MGKKILILDDDAGILEVLSILFVYSGYVIETLSSGEKVFDAIKAFNPDLVLMDVMLAKMDGRVICRQIKENPLTLSLPVILISCTHNLSASLEQQGAPNDFVSKPFDIDELIAKVKHHLDD